jgi:hypothetical protein
MEIKKKNLIIGCSGSVATVRVTQFIEIFNKTGKFNISKPKLTKSVF